MTRTAVYCRISDDRAGDAAGVKRQEKDCRALADSRGWEVAGVYVDNDVSAYSGKRRPEYERLCDDIRAGHLDALVAWHPDRLHRSIKELEAFIDLVDKAGILIETVRAGRYDLATATGRHVARVVGSSARYESEMKAERTLRKHAELAAAGAVVGGGRPFGYESDRFTIRDSEATLIREAAGRVLAGETLWGICADWQRRAVPSVSGGPWRQTSLRRVLTSARVAGMRSHGIRELGVDAPVVAPAVWPAILDDTTWQQVRAVLKDPGRRFNAGVPARSYLLSGWLFCGRCDTRMISRAHAKGHKGRRYVCSSGPGVGGCGGIAISADATEEEITDRALARLDVPALAEAAAAVPDDSDRLAGEIPDLEAQLDQLARDHYVDRLIGRSEFLAARQGLNGRLDEIRRSLAGTTRRTAASIYAGQGEPLRAGWDGLTLDQKRAAIGSIVDRVTVMPAVPGRNRFDPDRLDITWRW